MFLKHIIPGTYYLGLGLLLAALPFSNYMISVAQFMLAGVFITDGISKASVERFFNDYRPRPLTGAIVFIPFGLVWIVQGIARKMKVFFHRENAPAWALVSIYLLHVAGMFFTTDFGYAMKDLRVKLPLLLLPLILSTTLHVERRAFRLLMYLFIAAVTVATFISTYHLLFGQITDSREASIYISHIRFSMLIDIAIFAIFYLAVKKSEVLRHTRIILAVTALWLIAFLFLAAYMTGIIILAGTSAILLVYLIVHKRGLRVKIPVLVGVTAVIVMAFFYIRGIYREVNRVEPVDFSNLERVTAKGNPYWHDTGVDQVENGHYVWLYVSMDELRQAWNSRSPFDFDGKDKAGQELRYTLIRFLSSKGYRKDAGGVSRMTDEEIRLVEGGTASIVYVEKPTFYVRIYKIFWEYSRYLDTRNPSGHSVMQRIEFWRAAVGIIRENPATGVGTGDIKIAFADQYDKMGSLLDKEYRWRAHNQFLAITATFGFIGLAWFLFGLIFPAWRMKKFHDYYYLTFFIIIILSMITEDTLETQVGATQFAFFSAYYLFAKKFIDIV